MAEPTANSRSITPVGGSHIAPTWVIPDLLKELEATISTGIDGPNCSWFENRVVGLLASPQLGNASKLALGVSAVPAGIETPEHHHEAEEVAIVLSGTGEIIIEGRPYGVTAGSVVVTPSDAPHSTRASASETLTVLWLYAPPGSERRWIAENSSIPPTVS